MSGVEEIWKDVPGYGGHYKASSIGRIKSLERTVTKRHKSGSMITQKYSERILSANTVGRDGHLSVHLGVDGKKYTVLVHRLILLAFVGECPEGMEGCHNNGIPYDNRPENLRWDTHFNNNQDRLLHGTYKTGSDHHMCKFDNDLIKRIRNGDVSLKESGVSKTHFYRIKRGDSWCNA